MKHLLLDTSIFIRFLTHDVEDQYQESRELFMEIEDGMATGFVSLLTLQELLWALEYTYLIPKEEFVPLLTKLFSIKNLKVIECKKSLLLTIFEKYEKGILDFTSVYLLAVKDKREIMTFDKKLLKAIS
jgi:predicted nucleic acid-binding protein